MSSIHAPPTPFIVPIFVTRPTCRVCLKADPKKEMLTCKRCRLVSYCSQMCQQSDWTSHRADCEDPIMLPNWVPAFEEEKRLPDFCPMESVEGLDAFLGTSDTAEDANPSIDKFAYIPHTSERRWLYGRFPAVDILGLGSNEGLGDDKTVRLLFAASGDLRNLVKTVNELPKDIKRPLHVHINDQDWHVMSRNLILLLLALQSTDPLSDAELAVHYWYSAFIPDWCHCAIRNEMKESVNAEWSWKHSKLHAEVSKTQYMLLKALFHPLPGFDTTQAVHVARDASRKGIKGHQDHYDFALFRLPPHLRIGRKRFMETLSVSPFDANLSENLVYNPSFFAQGLYPVETLADPLEGWEWKDIGSHTEPGAPPNDMYGRFFYFVRSQFVEFCNRLRSLKTTFEISCVPAEELHQKFPGAKFDRIDASTLGDNRWLNNCQMLSTIGPLLEDTSVNPYATLISLHRELMPELFKAEVCKKCDGALAAELAEELSDCSRDTRKFKALLAWAEIKDITEAQLCKAGFWEGYYGVLHLRDFKKAWELYKRINHFDAAAAASAMRMKRAHTIVPEWPSKLYAHEDFDATYEWRLRAGPLAKKEFTDHFAAGFDGSARFVEWKRAVDPKANKRANREDKRKRQAHEGEDNFDHKLHYGHFRHGLVFL